MRKLLAVLSLLLLPLLILEVGLRLSGRFMTYSERIGHPWRSAYSPEVESGLLLRYEPFEQVEIDHGEFTSSWVTNQYGYRDQSANCMSEHTVFVYGDSFVEGIGAPDDSSIVSQFHSRLAELNPEISVHSFGIAGSDPFYDFMALKHEHLALHPDWVVFMLNESDLNDIILRGGRDRFDQENEEVVVKKGPWFEPLYGRSHLVRSVVHLNGYDFLLLQEEERDAALQAAADSLHVLLDHVSTYCQRNGIGFLCVSIPVPQWICPDLELPDQPLFEGSTPHVDVVCSFGNIVNDQTCQDLYWPIDGHYNGRGYTLLGDVIFDEIMAKHPDFFTLDTVP